MPTRSTTVTTAVDAGGGLLVGCIDVVASFNMAMKASISMARSVRAISKACNAAWRLCASASSSISSNRFCEVSGAAFLSILPVGASANNVLS